MTRASALLVAVLAFGAPATAQPTIEIFGGVATWFPSLDTVYDASYTPARVSGFDLFDAPDPRSQAIQELTLQGEASLGVGFGVNIFPHPVLGVQLLFDRASVDISGENPAHEVTQVYDSIAFPDSTPIVVTQEFEYPAADTTGTLDESALSFNLASRFGGAGVVTGLVSGGLSYLRFRANAERLGAHAAWLGGHAVLFSELYEMSYVTETADAFGFNLGGEVDIRLGRHAAAFVDARWFRVAATEVEVMLDEVLSQNVPSVPVTEIDDFLALPPLEIDPSYVRVLFGLKWKS